MRVLAFWDVRNYEIERHTLDNVSDIEAFDILWHKRDELNARFYNVSERDSDLFLNADDFETDYNDELLDGGHWCKTLRLTSYDAKQIIYE